jgi:hypothetical protein
MLEDQQLLKFVSIKKGNLKRILQKTGSRISGVRIG